MDFTDYINTKQAELATKKIPQEIKERWASRIVPRNLQTQGRAGAIQYLADYGKGIAAPKVVNLARLAAENGYDAMATGFWEKAYELETKQKAPLPDTYNTFAPGVSNQLTAQTKTKVDIPDLPSNLQPGKTVTMQAVDAPESRAYYVESATYWGQPKRDGQRLIISATPQGVFYQSRSTKLRTTPTPEIETALLTAFQRHNTFVLDGELYFQAEDGSEHRTGSQAATANIELGYPTALPQIKYAIFSALYYKQNLLDSPQSERIEAGTEVAASLSNCPQFELIATARTQKEKQKLIETQSRENREGEIWVDKSCCYRGGKDGKRLPIVRTKYYNELEVSIVNLTPTTAANRSFGAAEVAQIIDGKMIERGSVGVGFSQSNLKKIAALHAQNPGEVKIIVRTQGLTENGQLWHGRFLDFA